uniref:bcl-2-related protein A1-like n=1 Tax=Myxine glutinosa TaxID=7769 RepID=UPI00358F3C1C
MNSLMDLCGFLQSRLPGAGLWSSLCGHSRLATAATEPRPPGGPPSRTPQPPVCRHGAMSVQPQGRGSAEPPRSTLGVRTLGLVRGYVSYVLEPGGRDAAGEDKAAETLRRVADDVRTRHSVALSSYKQSLCSESCCNVGAAAALEAVAAEVFSDGITNWGRIVSLFAFTAEIALARCAAGGDRETTVAALSAAATRGLVQHAGNFIANSGGWDDGFVHFFEQQRDDAWLRDLLVMIAGIGLTATLAYRFVATR